MLCFLALGGVCSSASADAADPCHAFTNDAHYLHTTVVMRLEQTEVQLWVPNPYNHPVPPWYTEFEDWTRHYDVEIEGLGPISWDEMRRRNRTGVNDWMTIGIGDTIALEEIARWRATGNLGWEAGPAYSDLPRRPGPFGLTQIEDPGSEARWPAWNDDLYVLEDAHGRISTLILCGTPGHINYPSCEQSFRSSDLDVTINYRLSYLERWRELQADAEAFLDCASTLRPSP